MKFSVCLSTGYEGLVYPVNFCEPQDLVRQSQLAEKLGYDSVWGNDHITPPVYVKEHFKDSPNFYDVLITLAMIAQATTTLRVGTALLVMPNREPVYLAKQVSTIDQMSGGRFMMAIGLGAYREEFEAWVGNRYTKPHRGDMMEEGISIFRKLTTEKISSFDGKYYSYKDIEMFPKPKQDPFPLYVGGHNLKAVERAAEIGRGWLPGWRPFHEIDERIQALHKHARAIGRDPKEIEIAPQFSLLVGKTQGQAEKTYMQSGLVAHRASLAHTGRDPVHQVTANLVGSPQSIIDKIHQLKAMGVDHCAAMAVAVNTQAELLEQLHWFAEEVMPHVKRAALPRQPRTEDQLERGEPALKRTGLTPQHVALRAIETPALIVDVPVLKSNIDAMSASAKRAGLALRPHAKTHKSPEIASLQIKAGAAGIACATVAEAEMLARRGLPGLLLTAPQMGTDRFERIAKVNRDHGLTVVVDHARQVEGLAAAMRQGDRTLAVALDIDVGQLRTGITDIAEGVRIARMIAGNPAFAFAGVQGFAGHAQHIPDPQQRREAAAAAAQTIRDVASALASAGLPPTLVTGSGTGTYKQDCEGPYNELQVGSYVFMDADYARIVDRDGLGPTFAPSLFVLATVVSVNRPGQITVDAEVKALATNGPPPCEFIGAPQGCSYRFAGDEHGIITIPAGAVTPELGDRILIGATHCDPTVNLHAAYHAIDGNDLACWPILARYGA